MVTKLMDNFGLLGFVARRGYDKNFVFRRNS
jgi:hypothetical protein